ncbi:MAG: UvrD-helicase domain-containing protein [Fretibacterium sp.]|nr:UvrD-helicase domain-containing protein [Fretibacterium sp.]
MSRTTDFWDRLLLPPGTPGGQRAAVTAEGGRVTVGAGAGTGKTWVLSSRYARLLLTDPDRLPRDILTLTYTEAAAAEMRERIERRVRELLSAPGAPVSTERVQALLDGFGEGWISTIHAFAARLIRESGLSLNVDPRASLVSSPQEEEFWNELEDALEAAELRALAQIYGDDRLRRAAEALDADPTLGAALGRWGADGLRTLARQATELHASLGHTWTLMLDWADDAPRPDDPQVRAAHAAVTALLRPHWTAAWEAWSLVFRALGDEIAARGQKAREEGRSEGAAALLAACADRWARRMAAPEGPDDEALRLFYVDVAHNVKGASGPLFGAVKEILGMTVGDWQKEQDRDGDRTGLSAFAPDEPLAEPERRLRAALLRFCGTAWGLWDGMKRRRGLLSFSDMILHAREAVEDARVSREFRHILVDEFQDTDPLQFSMLETLREHEGAGLFAVGDPKQSIYRFRHADPALFARTIAEADVRVELNVSFRTRAALLKRINALFAHIWASGLGAAEGMEGLAFDPLSPVEAPPERDAGTLSPFSVLLSLRRGRGELPARERLARALAARIAGAVRSGQTVWDKAQGALRPVRWRDFAVLLRNRNSHDLLEHIFAEEGVPVLPDRSTDYFARGEVGDVIALMRTAADPGDEAALAGWLLSPLSGVPEAEALRCLEARADPPRGGSPTALADLLRERHPEAASRLSRLELLGRHKGPAALLEDLVRDRRWLSGYDPRYRLRALRNVRRALSLARAYQRGLALSLTGCARWMERSLRGGTRLEEPRWMDRDADAVLIATVHASKGLEYPVVAVFDTARRERPASLVPSRKLGLAFSGLPEFLPGPGEPHDDAGEEPRTMRWERLLSSQGDREEDMRLFYVAATRAQDALWLCGVVGEDAQGNRTLPRGRWTSLALAWLADEEGCGWPDLVNPEVRYVGEDGEHAAAPSAPGLRDAPPAAAPVPTAIPAPDRSGTTLASFSATSFALFEWCPLAWRRRYRQGLDLRWEVPDEGVPDPSGAPPPAGSGGAELGTLAHWILARWPSERVRPGERDTLSYWLSDPRVPARLPAGLRDVWRDPAARETLADWLGRFEGSEAGMEIRRALRMDRARREAPFRVRVGGLPLVGAMDVAWRSPDGPGRWRVLDYKITLPEDAPSELYRAQLAFYALVVRELADRRGEPFEEVDVGLVFLREGGRMGHRQAFPRNFGWDGLRARVLAAAQSAALGDWPPRTEHCRECPWAKGCPAAHGNRT